jgi:P4 family phage/plasmid primase-like protien
MEIKRELKFEGLELGLGSFPLGYKPLPQPLTIEKTSKDGQTSPKIASPYVVTNLFLTTTNLKFSRYFSESDLFFAYRVDQGFYIPLNNRQLDSLILRFALYHNVAAHTPPNFRKQVISDLKSLLVDKDQPKEDPFLIMGNGAYNIATKQLVPWSPQIFSLSKIPYNFDPEATCPNFLKFLEFAFYNDAPKIQFIRAYLWAILNGYTKAQIFIYLLGQGGTGKSTLTNILKSSLGSHMVLTTNLRELHNDKFEAYNILGKRLILISDTEHYQGDLSILKSITGNDALIGRIKHKSGSFEVLPRGLVIITGNTPLGSKDSGGALSRRIRVVPMNRKPAMAEQLYLSEGDTWTGILAPELPGILNWALSMDKESIPYLHQTLKMVPSMRDQHMITEGELNPILDWVRNCTVQGPLLGAYVGYVGHQVSYEKIILEGSRRGTLYPCYYIYMKDRGLLPVNQLKFIRELLDLGLTHSIPLEKVRRSLGIYIRGIEVQPLFYNRDSLKGAPLLIESSKEEIPILKPIRESLYERYFEALGKTEFKANINQASREIAKDLDPKEFTRIYLEELGNFKSRNELGIVVESPSQAFSDRLDFLYKKSITQLIKFGVVAYKYRMMGLSPRIIPQSYGASINSVRKDVRARIFSKLRPFFKSQGYVLLDVDLKSCYTSILLGLYPQELRSVQLAIEGQGLWKYIQGEFEAKGNGSLYNKAAVKICTYSSFFLGGNRAMVNGILEYFRTQLGMTPKEFRELPSHPSLYEMARSVAEVMQNSEIIQDFREISKVVMESHKGEELKGPTGHAYLVEEETFKSAYPNFLQSYEFALLAEGTLRFLEKFKSAILIGHFHDGNLILVKESEKAEAISELNKLVGDVGRSLNLLYPQTIETKVF